VLPTGEVLATGGTTGNDLTQAAHAAEVWNPSTGQRTTLASNVVSRGYHATSILLPDGRVLHSGSGDASNQVDERNAEIFSPPHLFHGPRPVITAAPAEAHRDLCQGVHSGSGGDHAGHADPPGRGDPTCSFS
jgi:galactose oxidase